MKESGLFALSPRELETEDLEWLIKLTAATRVGFTAGLAIQMAIDKKIQLWRIIGKAKGMLVTSIELWPKGSELRVWGMAGKGVFPAQVKYLIDDLLQVAVRWDCRWLAFTNLHPQVDKIYQRLMGKPLGTTYMREL